MKKTKDFIYSFEGFFHNTPGKCQIRIFESDEPRKIVGICSALPDNDGTSTTNRIEYIYADIKERFFGATPKNALNSQETITKLLQFISDNKTSKPWAIAASLILKGWSQFKEYNKDNPPQEEQLIWIDHWPKGIGLRSYEHEFALVKFTSDLEPVWYHMTEDQFEKEIGIDIRLLEPLCLEDEKNKW